MPTNTISDLEFHVERLIAELIRAREESVQLRKQLSMNAQERTLLQEKNAELREQVKRVIEQIKEDIS